MYLSTLFAAVIALVATTASAGRHDAARSRAGKQEMVRSHSRSRSVVNGLRQRSAEAQPVISPKLFIISMFDPEADVWYADQELNLLARNFTIPGFSMLFPDAHFDYGRRRHVPNLPNELDRRDFYGHAHITDLSLHDAEINAASTLTALTLSPQFNLSTTYFLIAGIAGGNPHLVTTGSVAFARYAVQSDLQYLFDSRQIPANDSTGYFPQNADYPDTPDPSDYPGEIYGTEAFELNDNLRQRMLYLARHAATLHDTPDAAAYRRAYGYAPADQAPAVVACDSTTSNDYISGSVLGDALTNYTALLTNGTGHYCATQQEDNATLEALLRAAVAGTLDFARIVLMRTISDFDRAPPVEDEVYHLLYAQQQGFDVSIANIYRVGIAIVRDVRRYWEPTYRHGIKPGNYVGDLFNSLVGDVYPDIG
ncbi:MAG: hypothetical protein M1818_000522 [Claussenomyces sp. TS43310]|nr:MAG: hypothetical protein M1818_000522 [Claussenomyces sp. TS43310]